MKLCKDCKEFYLTKPFMGNCRTHPWQNDKYTQDADAGQCKEFVDRSVDWMTARTRVSASAKEA